MIEKLIAWSVKNRFMVLMATLFTLFASIWAMKHTHLDALPDLSPPQVIVQVKWKGQSPKIIEDQGTYPLVSQFLAISNIETVRGFSTYENALIYIIFKEGTDLYWARSRVLEQLASIQSQLPPDMEVSLGPDASGVGWVYEYALVSKHKRISPAHSRRITTIQADASLSKTAMSGWWKPKDISKTLMIYANFRSGLTTVYRLDLVTLLVSRSYLRQGGVSQISMGMVKWSAVSSWYAMEKMSTFCR